MKTKEKKAKGPKRLKLSELSEKHGIPMWPKAYRDGLVFIAGKGRYSESDWVVTRVVLRTLHRSGHLDHEKLTMTCGGVVWFATPKGLKMRDGINAVEAERAEQKRLGHGLISAA